MQVFRSKTISSIDPEVQAVSLGRSLNEDLHRLFEEQDTRWSDCEVRVADQTFKCHKVILSSRSRYFQSAFGFHKGHLKQCVKPQVMIPEHFTADAIKSLLV